VCTTGVAVSFCQTHSHPRTSQLYDVVNDIGIASSPISNVTPSLVIPIYGINILTRLKKEQT